MEAIVLAGGFGTRLKEVVPDLPKPMAPIGTRPFLEILLLSLARKGFKRVVLSLGYMADRITDYFGSSFANMNLVYEVEDFPLGTGGAIRRSVRHIETDHVFIFNGDTYLELEVDEVEKMWQKDSLPIIVAREVSDTSRYGRLQTTNGFVTGFLEKGVPGAGLVNAGCYVFPTTIFSDVNLGEAFSLENDFLTEAVKCNKFKVFVSRGYFIDIGVPEDYNRAQVELPGVI